MKPLWVRLLIWGGMLVCFGLGLNFFAGESIALIGLVVILSLLHVQHLRSILHFRRWLAAPDTTEIPDDFGEWSYLYADLYRLRQREAQAQHGLETALARFRGASAALPDGVILLDAQQRIEWCNATAERYLSVSLQRDAGIQITQLVRQPAFVAMMRGASQDNSVVLRMGSERALLSILSIPFNSHGQMLVIRDVSQMERASAILRDFVANVSHELRTPLTVIVGYLELLSSGPAPSLEMLQRQYGLMLDEAKRMSRLVADLLVLSRLEASQAIDGDEVVNVRALLTTLQEEAAALSAGKHQFELVIASEDKLLGAAEELHSAVGNLVFNAVRYTPAGGKICLHWRVEGETPILEVADNGIGIPKEHIPRLTERFYRVDRGRSSATGGTGLGLAIVKHVLLRHQACLKVTSEPGKGSRFIVHFPPARRVVPEVEV